MKASKRARAFALVVLLVFTLLPQTARAADAVMLEEDTEPDADESLGADFDALVWDAIKGGNSAENDVKTALNLPKEGANGTAVAWSAAPAGIINTAKNR